VAGSGFREGRDQVVNVAARDVAKGMAEFRQRMRTLGYDLLRVPINARVSPQVR